MATGKNTSIYISTELAQAIKASGKKPVELIWRGLETLRPRAVEVLAGPHQASCPPHPKARIQKGLCMACGTHVG